MSVFIPNRISKIFSRIFESYVHTVCHENVNVSSRLTTFFFATKLLCNINFTICMQSFERRTNINFLVLIERDKDRQRTRNELFAYGVPRGKIFIGTSWKASIVHFYQMDLTTKKKCSKKKNCSLVFVIMSNLLFPVSVYFFLLFRFNINDWIALRVIFYFAILRRWT